MGFKGKVKQGMIEKSANGEWTFSRGTHRTKTLGQVALKSLSYLLWVQKDASSNLTDEAFYALSDEIDRHTKGEKK